MTGPTTTGSIDAKLTIDKSAWDRNKDEAKAEAAELGALNPEIRVDANVGPALAKLAAVAKAERDLETAYMRSAIAQDKLDAVTTKYGEDSLQAASARLTLKRATDAETDAEHKLAASKARTTVEQEKETASTERALRTQRMRISGMQVLLALAPAIVAAAAPVAGAAVGLAGAFGIMAVSGVIAIKGIKDEMEKGTTTGNMYAAGLGSLKTNLDSLGATSANRMLGAFSTTVGDINARMPGLTTAVGDGSAALGNLGGTVLRNVLDGLGEMKPLLQAGSVELSKFVGWLTDFSKAQGFQSFVSYATTNLPGVMEMLGKLVVLAGNILAAFAPLGPVVIGFISGTADALNSVPLPVLAGIVTGAVLLGPALRMAFAPGVAGLIISVAQAIGLTGVMANLAVPVVGILTAVIAGVGVAAAASSLGTDQGTAALVNYGDAVERDNGLIGENVRLQAAHAATTKEMREAADSLGVSTDTVLKAMLGNTDAQDELNKVMSTAIDRRAELKRGDENLTETSLRLSHAKETLTNGIAANSGSIKDNVDAYAAYQRVIQSTSGALTDEGRALQENAGHYGVSVGVYQQAMAAQDKAKISTEGETIAMQLQNDAAGLLKQQLDLLSGKTLSYEQTQNSFEKQLNTATSQLNNAKAAVDAHGKSLAANAVVLEGTSDAAVNNRGTILSLVDSAQRSAEAFGKMTGKSEDARLKLIDQRQAIIDNMVANGLNRDSVTNYIDAIMKIPASVPPTKVEVDQAALAAAEAQLARLTQARTVHIQAQVTGGGGGGVDGTPIADTAFDPGTFAPIHKADGGEVNYLASGGVPAFKPKGTDTVPAMLTPEEFVVKRASAKSIGRPALDYMNSTGQIPPTGSGANLKFDISVNGAQAPREVVRELMAAVRWELQKEGVRLGR